MSESEEDLRFVEEGNHLDHLCRLRFDKKSTNARLTAIVCTIGHSSRTVDVIANMILNGMSIARMNFAHGSHDYHLETIGIIQKAAEMVSKELGYEKTVALMLDTKGSEIRTGLNEGGGDIDLRNGDIVRLSTNKNLYDKCNKESIYVDYPDIIHLVKFGSRVLINDGQISLFVKEVAIDCLICQVDVGGILPSLRNVTVPGMKLNLPNLSEKDAYDISFAVENSIDIIVASNVRSTETISEIRSQLGHKSKHVKVVAKIENLQAMELLSDLIQVSDGILLGRAGIGIELNPERLFLLQKALVGQCNKAGKPVIIGANILDSMIHQQRPVLADVFDLGNIVLDGADGIMITHATGIGKHPIHTTKQAHKVCRDAENALWYHDILSDLMHRNPALVDAIHAIAVEAVNAAKKTAAAAIVVLTTSGKSAYLISRYRPRCPIIAITTCPRTSRQALLYRGVLPLLYPMKSDADWVTEIDSRVKYALSVMKRNKMADMGDAIVVVSNWRDGKGFTNNLRIVYAVFEEDPIECELKDELNKTETENI
ncbi:pyruvate kinase-like [Teleopsis dalmanni]|uniref:pyruvate kinase-like n=1 Tax=Teleopsis dalmanni TaxID=139649 RepID=UPI000D32BC3E|nr:pyruvate kinase-like [Teleopsis dalmanni]